MIYSLLLVCCALSLAHGQNTEVDNLIIEAPVNQSAALGTLATVSCRGNGTITWLFNNIQVRANDRLELLADNEIFTEFGQDGVSTSNISATVMNNGTKIVCRVETGDVLDVLFFQESEVAHFLVYGLPLAPTNLQVGIEGFAFNLTWVEPFIHEGETVTYQVDARDRTTGRTVSVIAPSSPFLFNQVIEERDCATYEYTVRTRNDVGLSTTGIFGSEEIPTAPNQILANNVTTTVTLTNGVRVELSFPAPTPCSEYSVLDYSLEYRAFEDPNDLNNIAEQRRNIPATPSNTPTDTIILTTTGEGIVADRVVYATITASNSVGSTQSEEIVFYTSSVQSAVVTIDDDYVGTATCTFASGTDIVGCYLVFNEIDSNGNSTEILTLNITTAQGTVTDIQFDDVPDGGEIVATVQAILNDGGLSLIAVSAMVTGPFTPTTQPPTTTPPATTESTVMMTPDPTVISQELLYIIVGAGGGGILLLLVLIILITCCICCCTRRKNKSAYATVHKVNDELCNNNAYGGIQLTGANGLDNHARTNTYLENSAAGGLGPAYETIDDAKKAAQAAGATLASNPIYAGATAGTNGSQATLINGSQTALADNPVYAAANQKARMACTDVSALNPIYAGVNNASAPVPVVPAPLPPQPPGFPYQSETPTSPYLVPQPSPAGPNSQPPQQPASMNRSQSTDLVPPYKDPTYSYAEVGTRVRNAVSTSSDQEKPAPFKRNESYGLFSSSTSPLVTSPPPYTPTVPENGSTVPQNGSTASENVSAV